MDIYPSIYRNRIIPHSIPRMWNEFGMKLDRIPCEIMRKLLSANWRTHSSHPVTCVPASARFKGGDNKRQQSRIIRSKIGPPNCAIIAGAH